MYTSLTKVDKVKTCYVDNRFRPSGSVSDGGFKFELKEQPGYQIILFVMSMIFQFLTHGEQLSHITTRFIR